MIITTVTTDSGAILPLGRQMEHGVRQVWFDLSYLIENFGEGTAILVHQRNQDLAPYIVTTEQTNTNLMWTIDETDTAYEGFGRAEIRWVVDDDLAKTVIYKTNVQKSLTAQTEVPEPLESWYDQMIEYIDERSISPDQIDEAVAEYLDEHPVVAPVDSVNGKTGTVVLDAEDVGALPDSTVIPSKTSDLQNDSGFITGYTETDPTVPAWAKAANKPTYTAQEVGALPSSTVIPTKTSDLQNDSGYITGYTETDPTVPSWAKQASKPTYTAAEVGALPVGTAIPSKTSDLTNDSGYITSAPVSSVNGRTGAVTGLIDAPSSPATGAFLVWNGSTWVAQVLTDADSTSYGGTS